MKILCLALISAALFSSVVLGQEGSIAEEAIKNIFPAAQTVMAETRFFQGEEIRVYIISAAGTVIGRAVVLDEMGKIKPITFLVGIDAQGKVAGVQILKYLDMFGAEIKRRSFLRQFQGKSKDDKISIGADIDAVTSATISSRAAASAVRKAIIILG